MKTAFIYSDQFARFNYGASHPLKPFRLKLTYELMKACHLLDVPDPRLIEPKPADDIDLLTYHSREYIDFLDVANNGLHVAGGGAFGIGPGDNPIFPGMLDWSKLVAGASLKAAVLVDDNEAAIAFNIAGGLHHAHASRASGFCYINDPVLAIQLLVGRGRRVIYIDIDAHHADGVQEAFYSTDRVLTISLHETGSALFPGSGFEYETGEGAGRGYSVNVPLPPETDDELFVHAFTEVVPPLVDIFKPDVVVTQLGVDTFHNDPLAHLNITTDGFCRIVQMIKAIAPKWLALGGGGYDMANVARAWTIVWAIMNDVAAPDKIPGDFLRQNPAAGFHHSMKDDPLIIEGKQKEVMRKEVEKVIDYIKEQVLRNA